MDEGEFSLIERLFKRQAGGRHPFTRLGIGDDASIHHLSEELELVVSSDSSLQGIHWPDDLPLEVAADRAVCSALSDLAAMGAEALAAWLNVMAVDRAAVEAMAAGAHRALQRYRVDLAGGDTCRSRHNALAVTVCGELPAGTAMRRDRAKVGDNIYVAGSIGRHALGLQRWMESRPEDAARQQCRHLFETITPQLQRGVALREMGVRCCIDVSDGLVQDAGHIAAASEVAMQIEVSAVPDWAWLCEACGRDEALRLVARGGEDYALLFTAPPSLDIPPQLGRRVGHCEAGRGVALTLHGTALAETAGGYDHFG